MCSGKHVLPPWEEKRPSLPEHDRERRQSLRPKPPGGFWFGGWQRYVRRLTLAPVAGRRT